MDWLSLTLASVVVASIASILQRTLMKGDNSNPYSYAIIFHFLLGLIALTGAKISGSELSLTSGNVNMLLLAGILWGACQVFLFKALQLLEVSEVTIISDIRVIITIVASVLLLGESFTTLNIIGAALILVASMLIVDRRNGFKFNKGVWYTLAMALFAGLAIVADSANMQTYDALTYSAFSNFISGFFVLMFFPQALKQWPQFVQPVFLMKMLPLAVFSTTQGVLYLLALSYGENTAQVGTIRQASVIVTVLLAVIFLNERSKLWQKLGAAVLVTGGVFLLR